MVGVELAVREQDFEAVFDEARATLALSGRADPGVAGRLEQLIHQIHERAAQTIEIDLANLELMAASCFNVFAVWVGLINELPPARRYPLRFTINPAVPWQKRSLTTLMCFATDIVSVR